MTTTRAMRLMATTLQALRRQPNPHLQSLLESTMEPPGADDRRAAAQAKRERKNSSRIRRL